METRSRVLKEMVVREGEPKRLAVQVRFDREDRHGLDERERSFMKGPCDARSPFKRSHLKSNGEEPVPPASFAAFNRFGAEPACALFAEEAVQHPGDDCI
jgi:hypothetical protein